jgi:hypothetical protein
MNVLQRLEVSGGNTPLTSFRWRFGSSNVSHLDEITRRLTLRRLTLSILVKRNLTVRKD